MAVAVPTSVSALTEPSDRAVLALNQEREALSARINDWREPMGDEQLDALLDQLFAIEEYLYQLPCTSMARAVAKLGCLALSFDRGDRIDGTEEEVAAEIVAFLKGRL